MYPLKIQFQYAFTSFRYYLYEVAKFSLIIGTLRVFRLETPLLVLDLIIGEMFI